MRGNVDVIADIGGLGGRARANRADLAQRAVDSDLGILDRPDLRSMLDEQTRPDFRIGMEVNASNDDKNFAQRSEQYSCRSPKPGRS